MNIIVDVTHIHLNINLNTNLSLEFALFYFLEIFYFIFQRTIELTSWHLTVDISLVIFSCFLTACGHLDKTHNNSLLLYSYHLVWYFCKTGSGVISVFYPCQVSTGNIDLIRHWNIWHKFVDALRSYFYFLFIDQFITLILGVLV